MSLSSADLLAGPRGRRLCLEMARTARTDSTEATEALSSALFYAAYDLDPGRGTSVVLFGPGADRRSGPPPAPSPAEVGRLLGTVSPPECDERTLLLGLRSAVDSARYWQDPDGEDVLAGTPEVRAALAGMASAIATAPSAAQWSQPMDAYGQWSVTLADATGPVPPPPRTAAETLAAWQSAQVEEEAVARRDRPVDPAAMISGTWWSRPPYTLTKTTPGLAGRGPVGLWLVEDGFSWETATAERIQVPGDARIFEIDGPDAWADLVRRYPLDVTASRRQDWYRTTGRSGAWAIPDWSQVQHDVDAVHLSIAGYLTTAGRAIPLDEERSTVLAGWDPDATFWLRDVISDAESRLHWFYDRGSANWELSTNP